MSQINAVDFTFLKQLRDMGRPDAPDIVRTVIEIFLKNSPEIVDSISSAIQSKDYVQASRAAHKLKSGSANIGAKRLLGVLERFENFTATGDVAGQDEECKILFGLILKEYKEVSNALNRELSS